MTAVRRWWRGFSDGLREFYVAPYRRTFARAQREEDDLFTLIVLSEALGVPNPASYYTIELLPLIHERVHEWHTRMGMDRSPLENVSCC
ncbi:hypothetical protein GCM10028784_35050 [Myceligenerans cantabricum]